MKIILGAGISGLGAYYAASDAVIYEKAARAGGLCGGFEIGGWHFDNAVHLSFTTDGFVRELFDRTESYEHKPLAYSWYHEKWLRHPAQNNLFPCSTEEKIAAVKGFLEREEENDTDNFAAWTRSRYGGWLFEHFFKPYNEKYWCVDIEELGTEWIGNRIYRPTLDELLYGSYTSDTPNTYYAEAMRYPKRGGYLSFVQDIIKEAEAAGRLICRKEAARIIPSSQKVFFKDGSYEEYDELYSSIPLPEMAEIVDGMPDYLKKKAGRLEHTGVVLVSVGFNQIVDCNKMWFYFYDDDIMASRAYMPSVKSPNNAPDGCSSVQFEIYFNAKSGGLNQKKCIENCIYAIRKINLAEESDIEFLDYRVLKYANVIFKKDSESIAAEITGWLRENGIIPIGRFGEWKYLWSDQAFLSGYYAVKGGKTK